MTLDTSLHLGAVKGKEDLQPMKGNSLTDISDSGNISGT